MAAFVNDSDVAEFMEYMLTDRGGRGLGGGRHGHRCRTRTSTPTHYPNVIMQKDAELINSARGGPLRWSRPASAGGDLGALLQSALRGEDMAPLLEEFQTEVTTAWETQ